MTFSPRAVAPVLVLLGACTAEPAAAQVVVANYRSDFQYPSPKPGWSYLWNANGPIGNSANYSSLVPYNNNPIYMVYPDGYPQPFPAYVLQLTPTGGHPGRGINQIGGGSFDRYAIAAFTVAIGGNYEIRNGYVNRPGGDFAEDDVLRIYVNNTPLFVTVFSSPGNLTFNPVLGALSPGDRIYFAVGPNGRDLSDSFGWNFDIVATSAVAPEPEPVWLMLLVLGGFATRRMFKARLFYRGTAPGQNPRRLESKREITASPFPTT